MDATRATSTPLAVGNPVSRHFLIGLLILCSLTATTFCHAAEVQPVKSFTLRYVSPGQVEPILRQLVAPDTRIIVDTQGNKLVVMGRGNDLEIASGVVSTLDKPAAGSLAVTATPAAAAIPMIKSYPVPRERLGSVAVTLRNRVGTRSDVTITTDERTSQVLVVAPQDVHATIATFLLESPSVSTANTGSNSVAGGSFPAGTAPTQGLPMAAGAATGTTPMPNPVRQPASVTTSLTAANAQQTAVNVQQAGAQQTGSENLALWNLRGTEFEAALQSMLGPILEAVAVSPQAGQASYRLSLRTGEKLDLTIDRVNNQVLLAGPAWSLPSARQLVHALDIPPSNSGVALRVIPISTAKEATVKQAAQAIRVANSDATQAAIQLPPGMLVAQAEAPQPQTAPAGEPPQAAAQQPEPAAPGQQPPAAGAQPESPPGQPGTPSGQPAAVPGQQPPGAEGAPPSEGGLIGPVQVEFLEGLDVLVVRGNRRDVERVMQIIREIEEMSFETEPEIRVVMLKHVDCEALLDIIDQVYQNVYAARRGSVTMIALVKPNALLLAGRQEAIRTVLELVRKLDRPVSPESEFKVFPLKHASATAVEQRLTAFYTDRGGLGTQILVTSDFRSNAVIVKASPRDMAEIDQMIAKLDVPSAEAVNEIKVFTLKNSLASELAPILQQAIQAQSTGLGGLRQTATGQLTTQLGQQQQEVRSTRLRFLTVDTAGKRLLESGIVTDVRITADARANALVVAAPEDSMPLIEALVAELDRLPSAEAQVKVFTIVNGDAQALADMLQTLFGQTITVTGGAAGFGGTAGQPIYRTGAQEGESSLIPLRFGVDIRTNSIIASGAAGDLAVVEAILLRLDESEVIKRRTQVFRLKNAPANDVASAINTYLTNERQVRQLNVNVFSTFEFLSKEVVIVPEPVSNSLIVSSTPEYFEQIVQIITELDERPPMVLIQVLIAEVQLSNTDEFGIELGIQDPILFDRSVAGVPGFLFNNTGPLGNNTATPSTDVVGAQAISNFGVGRGNPNLGFGGMVLSASSDAVSVLIRALRQQRRMDVLSRPQVMALDNQAAYIQVGQQVPTITGTSVTQNTQVNTVTFTNTGLILLVRPRISPDGQVVMEINAEKSDVGPESEGIPISVSASGEIIRSPRINTTRAQTTVSAGDGQTVILGGLITKDRSVTTRRVPGLSDIPILRHLFRYDMNNSSRSELLIILTPHIVRTDSDVERVRQVEAARMHWCLADVVAMHEDIAPNASMSRASGLRQPTDQQVPANGQEVVPTPAPLMPTPAPVVPNSSSVFPNAAPGASASSSPAQPEPILAPAIEPIPDPMSFRPHTESSGNRMYGGQSGAFDVPEVSVSDNPFALEDSKSGPQPIPPPQVRPSP